MPNFGYSSQGASESTYGSGTAAHRNAAEQYQAVANKMLETVSIYTRVTTGTGSIEAGVYDMGASGTDPNGASLLGKHQFTGITNTSMELKTSTDLDLNFTNGNGYTTALGYGEESGATVKVAYDAPGGSQMRRDSTTGTMPATFTANLSDSSVLFSVYATYGDQPAAPVFSGTIPDYTGARTTPVSITTASYFSNPETFSAANLPSGAAINTTTGEITWASPANGTYSNITVTCSNGLGSDTSNAFSITINAQAPVQTTSITNKTGNVSSAITPYDASQNFDFADTYSATGLPAGLSIDTNTGIISGTPTTEQTYAGVYVTATNVDGSTDSNTFQWDIQAALPIPTITDVNGGNNLQRNTTVTITGTNFESPQGTGTVTFNGTSLTISSWSDTSIDVSVPVEGFVFGSNHDLVVTNDSGYSVTVTEQFVPESGYSFATSSVSYAQLPNDSFLSDVVGLEAFSVGDQVAFQTSSSPSGTVSVDDTIVAVLSGITASGDYTFNYYINDISDLTVSSNGSALVTYQSSDADVTAPTWSTAPAASNIGQTTATATGTINETGDIFLVVVPLTEATPTSAQVIAGQNAVGGSPVFSDSALAGTSINSSVTGLTNDTNYKFCFVARDDETTPNVQAAPTVVTATTLLTPDLTPPAFVTGPTVSSIKQTSCDVSATIDEAGTIYLIVIDQALRDPTPSEVINGEMAGPNGELIAPTAAASATSFSSFTVSGLAAGTAYKACFVARDTEGNAQADITNVNFTTSTAGTVRSVSVDIVDGQGSAVANTLVDYVVKDDWATVTDSGQVTTDGSGNISLTNLNASAGAGFVEIKDPNDSNVAGIYPVTITEA